MKRNVQLEKAAEAVSDSAVAYPRIYQLPPREGREVLERTQDSPVFMYPAEIINKMVMTKNWGRLHVYMVKPECVQKPADVIPG